MSELLIKGMRLSLTGPESLPLPVVVRGSPAYDGPRNFFVVSLTNVSDSRKTLPLDELRRNISRLYRNPATGQEIFDNRTPPPKLDGAVEGIAPGQTTTFEIVFEYPARIATINDHVAVLQFCAKWESKWLRTSAYSSGAFDWNESFELCREIRIVEK